MEIHTFKILIFAVIVMLRSRRPSTSDTFLNTSVHELFWRPNFQVECPLQGANMRVHFNGSQTQSESDVGALWRPASGENRAEIDI